MSVSKDCGTGTGCVTSGGSNLLHGGTSTNFDSNNECYKYILSNGMTLIFYNRMIYVDVDGPRKGSYTFGKDLFAFEFDQFDDDLHGYGKNLSASACFESGIFCTYWVLTNGNLDYVKADANGKCTNSDKTLSDTVTSCK